MKKVWLYVKLVAVLVVAAAAVALYMFLKPRRVEAPTADDPSPPEPVEAPDFVTKMRQREKEIRDEIKSMSRDDLVDDVNDRVG